MKSVDLKIRSSGTGRRQLDDLIYVHTFFIQCTLFKHLYMYIHIDWHTNTKKTAVALFVKKIICLLVSARWEHDCPFAIFVAYRLGISASNAPPWCATTHPGWPIAAHKGLGPSVDVQNIKEVASWDWQKTSCYCFETCNTLFELVALQINNALTIGIPQHSNCWSFFVTGSEDHCRLQGAQRNQSLSGGMRSFQCFRSGGSPRPPRLTTHCRIIRLEDDRLDLDTAQLSRRVCGRGVASECPNRVTSS